MTEQELVKMKEKIELEKQERSRLEGKRDSLLERLKTEFGCDSIEEAKLKLGDLETRQSELDEQIVAKTDEIEKRYAQLA